jgi:hypothetical protein
MTVGKKRIQKKLMLERKTIQALTDDELGAVAGGNITPITPATINTYCTCPPRTCGCPPPPPPTPASDS